MQVLQMFTDFMIQYQKVISVNTTTYLIKKVFRYGEVEPTMVNLSFQKF